MPDSPLAAAQSPAHSSSFARVVRRSTPTTAALAVLSTFAVAPHAAAAAQHTVHEGETVSEIALHHGANVQDVITANHLDSQASIRPGQLLAIPTPTDGKARKTRQPSRVKKATSHHRTHRVVAGDTVWDLARTHHTTVDAIVTENHLDSRALIRIGQRLRIPTTSSTASAHSSSTSEPTTTRTSRSKKSTQPVGSTFAGRTYASSVVAAANQNKAALNQSPAPSQEIVKEVVAATARAHHIDPRLAVAIATQESGLDQRAVSPANAVGVMQVTPIAADWAQMLTGHEPNLLDTRDNVEAGVTILAQLLATSTSTEQAVASYYQGQSSVRRYGMFRDTRGYVASVLALRDRS